jgi:hypothetical protein
VGNLGNIRLADGTGYLIYSAARDAAVLIAQGSVHGSVSRTVDTGDLRPAPSLMLVGQLRLYLPLVVKE